MTAEQLEAVHTVTKRYDGPVRGVPISEANRTTTNASSTPRPTNGRHLLAFHQKRTTLETHPALPEDRARRDELAAIIKQRLVIDRPHAWVAQAQFEWNTDDGAWGPLRVRPTTSMTRRLATIALLLTLWTPPWLYAGEPPFTVLPSTETVHLGRLCSRDGPGKVSEGWLPTPEQILQAETLLPKFVRANGRPKGPLNYYYRQYLGVVIGDKRLIYVNVFPRWLIEREELRGISPSNWRTAFINICDGGDGFWGALYDPKTLRFSSPSFNGAA